MSFSTGIALALAAVINSTNPSAAATFNQSMPQAQTVQEYIQNYFLNEPVMIKIAECESHFTQYGKDGQVVKNPNSTAVGVFQIMASVHGTLADQKLGIDINTLQGNAAYAQYLYQTQGTAPWSASKACWGKTAQTLAVAAK
jgi:hypothetical protein